jgi:hypothetical protein
MGIYDGNNSNQDLDGLFGVSGWTETFKVDAPSGTDEVLTTTTNSDDTMGTWEFDFTGYKDVMFVLKGGNTFTAYLMDVDGPSMGAWRSDDLLTGGGKRGAGLSHFSAYTTPVPLPAAVWLFGAAILGMAGFSRRRKA